MTLRALPAVLAALGFATAVPSLGSAAAAHTPGVALVELFTSEGCSSCPPADALLARIEQDATRDGRRVFCLSFHVDYWNHLGWRDRFSTPEFTHRQDTYARRFSLASLYTPQMVVNGEREFVGSDAAKAAEAIRDGLARPERVAVEVRARSRGEAIDVSYVLTGAPKDAVLHVAWVDANAASKPDGGENGGRALAHVDVVRDLRSIAPGAEHTGTFTLRRPDPAAGRVVAWVQAGETGPVLGANATPLIAK